MNSGLLDGSLVGARDLDLAPGTAVCPTPFARLVELTEDLRRRLQGLEGELVLLRDLVTRDPMTGLRNRRYLDERLREEWARVHRYGSQCSVMLLDVDHFKEINDRYGHAVGDEVLRGIARRLQANVRAPDVVVRWGGDEFAVLLPETSEREAVRVGQRMLQALRPGPSGPHDGTPSIEYTLSIGIAGSGPDMPTPQHLVAAADEMMYRAKQSGGNRLACQCYSVVLGGRPAPRDENRRNQAPLAREMDRG